MESKEGPTLEDLSSQNRALWPLQMWLNTNVRDLIEPHLVNFKDSLSHLSHLYDKLLDREEKQNKRLDALEKKFEKLEAKK